MGGSQREEPKQAKVVGSLTVRSLGKARRDCLHRRSESACSCIAYRPS
jgi:hypothetical protein